MKISIHASHAKERFETARQHATHSERIAGNAEVIPRDVEKERALPPQSNSVKNIRHGASCAGSQAAASV
jgi:hypothetical protein